MLLLNLYIYLSALMVPFQMCKLHRNYCTPIPSEIKGFELSADNKLVSLLYNLQDAASIVSKKKFNLIRLTTERFTTLPQSLLNELLPREDF